MVHRALTYAGQTEVKELLFLVFPDTLDKTQVVVHYMVHSVAVPYREALSRVPIHLSLLMYNN